jgi:protein-S-isoprenylcysteine O-methyltransferase Ste14
MKLNRQHYGNLLPLVFTLVSVGIFIFYFSNRIHNYFGMVLIIIGLVIWWSGKITLGDAWAIRAQAKKLITNGIYSKIRNPIYLGLVLTIIGWAVYIPCLFWAIASLITIPILIVRARNESKVLSKKFGKKYKNYKKKTWF